MIQNREFSVPWNRGTEYYPVEMKTHIEYPDIFFWKYNSPYHIEMGTYLLIELLWAGGPVAPAQTTSLRWNWGIFAQSCSTCLEGPHRKDSSGAHPYRAIDRAWEPSNTFPVQFKGYNSCYRIQNREFSVPLELGHKILPCRNENSYRVPWHIFFENIIVLTTLKWAPTFSSIYYEQVALLHPPNRLASDETEEFLPKHVPHV